MVFVSGLPEVGVAQSSDLATGSIGGTVKLVFGQHVLPVADARLELMSISDEGPKFQATTDGTGRYTIDLPQGTYRMLLSWKGGDDCSEIHRASFRLEAAARLTLDFLVKQCPSSEPVWKYLPAEDVEKYVRSQKERNPMNVPLNPMNIPLTEQAEKYQEQLIPAEQNRWPEIVLSFGKYDNRGDVIRYFPLHQLVLNPFHIPDPPIPLSLPVTVTADRYTLRALDVVWDKKAMVFKAKGEVSVSDGQHESTGSSATLSFSSGLPNVQISR